MTKPMPQANKPKRKLKKKQSDIAMSVHCLLPEFQAAERDRAGDLLNRGMDFSDGGHPAEALRCLTEAVTLLHAPWAKLGSKASVQKASLQMGAALFTMGRTLRRAGRLDEAAAKLGEALSVLEALQTKPVGAKAQEEMAWVLAEQSIVLREQGRLEEAQGCAARAVSTVEALAAPVDSDEAARLLMWTLRCEGKTLERLHRDAEASERYKRAAVLATVVKHSRQAETGEDSPTERRDTGAETPDDCSRYSILRDGRALDSLPMEDGMPLLVFDKPSGKWVDFDGTVGEWRHSIAITAKEAARLTGGAATYKPPKRPRAKSKAPVADAPPEPPFSVEVVDQYEGGSEDGYSTVGSYDKLEDAVAEARRITTEAIKKSGGYMQWEGMGDAALIYDSTGKLIWSGIKVAKAEHKRKSQSP